MLPERVQIWLKDQGYGQVSNILPVGGGCINNGSVLQTSSGNTFFIKTNHNAPSDMFAKESASLLALRRKGAPIVPLPLLDDTDFLLMEDLAPGKRSAEYWPEFGRQLATLHNNVNDQFGFFQDNYIGSTPQPNPWVVDGYTFFGQARIGYQAQLAHKRGLLTAQEVGMVEQMIARLPDLVPTQPASLIHGDLWSGNATTNKLGHPALIDPAAHYGWAEAELAMTDLFGSFPDSFYETYLEVRPLERGYRSRFPLYNLYHLINHLNLFGGGYYGQVVAILRRYAG